MNVMLIDAISSPSVWLWLAATAMAVLLLTGLAGRRRSGLIDVLRAYVKRSQDASAQKTSPPPDDSDSG